MSHCTTKPTRWHVRLAKTQIRLGIRPVWSESSLCAWRKPGSLATNWAPAKTLIRQGGCPGWFESSLGVGFVVLRLIWGDGFRQSATSLALMSACMRTRAWRLTSCHYAVTYFMTGPDSSVGRVSAPGNGRSRVWSRAATYQSRKKWY